jgi:hypothetical protein
MLIEAGVGRIIATKCDLDNNVHINISLYYYVTGRPMNHKYEHVDG